MTVELDFTDNIAKMILHFPYLNDEILCNYYLNDDKLIVFEPYKS